MLRKLKRIFALVGIALIGSSTMIQPKEAMASTLKIKMNSWNISNFSDKKDLWSSNVGSYSADAVKGRVVTGDFDGNGKDEIAAFYDYGNLSTNIHRFVDNNGTLVLSTAWESGKGNFDASSITNKVATGDFNGDGKDEIVALYDYNNGTGKVFKFSLGSDNKFTVKTMWSPTGFEPKAVRAVVAGDFDGDGKDELLIFYDYGNEVTGVFELRLNSSGTFTSKLAWKSETFDSNRIAQKTVVGDFNGDKKDEVAMFYYYGSLKTALWTMNYSNSSYSITKTWEGTEFDGSKINGKVAVTKNENGVKDRIVTIYERSNSASIFTWDMQTTNKFTPSNKLDITDHNASTIAGNVTLGKYDGSVNRLVALYDEGNSSFSNKIIQEATKHLRKPYVWGAKGPSSFDCSGFIQYVFSQLGVHVPAPTTTQVRYGVEVSYANLQKGDLVFFNNTYNGANPTHVGIYSGDGQMIHCGDDGVAYATISSGYWRTNFATGRRITK